MPSRSKEEALDSDHLEAISISGDSAEPRNLMVFPNGEAIA
jgi:hypothetical protein